jgi:plastocyanin
MRRLSAAVAVLATVALSGCGGDEGKGGSDARASTGAPAPQQVGVKIASFKYQPAKLTVKRGATVRFTNFDDAPHTATVADGFDTGRLDAREAKGVRLDKPGSYKYYCEFHRFMQADITVR